MNSSAQHRTSPTHCRQLRRSQGTAAALALLLAGCGGGGGGGVGNFGNDVLKGSLDRLGVDTRETRRETAPGLDIAPETTPIGRRATLDRVDELVLVDIGKAADPIAVTPLRLIDLSTSTGQPTEALLHTESAANAPFLLRDSSSADILRTTVAADLDGDGRQEVVTLHQDGIELRAQTIGSAVANFATREFQIATYPNVTHVAAIAVDLDLDGRDEIVVAVTSNSEARLRAFASDGVGLVAIGTEQGIPAEFASSRLQTQLAVGNVDDDAAPEIAVAVQELFGSGGRGRCHLFDDLAKGFAPLKRIELTLDDQDQILRTAVTASVALGDVDGDGRDELLLGGVCVFATGCNAIQTLLVAIDDATTQFDQLSVLFQSRFYPGCNSPTNRRIRTIFLHALDYDGDGVDEVVANDQVFDDFEATTPWTPNPDWSLPVAAIWDNNSFGMFDRTSASMAIGNWNGDTREDIAIYRHDTTLAKVYALPATAMTTQLVRQVSTEFFNSQSPVQPQLIAADVDSDGAVIDYSAADYRLVFSEPIVLAALAAPPTRSGVGQNVGGSFTAFGNTTSASSESERSISFSAAVSVGVNLDGGLLTQSELELRDTLRVTAERKVGRAYELSRTILFSSAPTEDLVVFTCVPIDRYVYTIVSHPDPTLVGQKVVVDFPRTPVIGQAERRFYNATVPDGAQRVGDDVFGHVIGDPSTYPGVSQRNQLLATNGGLQAGPVSVGQGAGTTEVTLQVGSAVTTGGSLEVGYERDVQVTAGGVLVGLQIGVASTNSWQLRSGTSTTYTGVVGAIDAANFAANRYSFGLFTYVRRVAGEQQFQVLNYWVQ